MLMETNFRFLVKTLYYIYVFFQRFGFKFEILKIHISFCIYRYTLGYNVIN